MVEEAMGGHALALLRQLDAACQAADELAEATAAAFGQHPDAQIIGSFPGLGEVAGARVLAEIGDDRSRLADARALKAYAGSAPVTRASGRNRLRVHRQGQEPAARRGRLRVGLRLPHRLAAGPGPL
jgi:transposase